MHASTDMLLGLGMLKLNCSKVKNLSPGVVGKEGVDLIVGVDIGRHELARPAREREGGYNHGHKERVDEPETKVLDIRSGNHDDDDDDEDLFF